MNYTNVRGVLFGLIHCIFLFNACSKDNPPLNPTQPVHEEKIIRNLKGDYSTKPFFKFSTGEVVKTPAGDNWDICFEHAQLKINGGTMDNPIRTGDARAVILHTAYLNVKNVPNLGGLRQDVGKEDYALGYRSGGKTWYFMDANYFYIPYPEKTLFFQTADKKGFVKMQILSFYRDMPSMIGENYETMGTRGGYFTFRYQYIEKGQRFQ